MYKDYRHKNVAHLIRLFDHWSESDRQLDSDDISLIYEQVEKVAGKVMCCYYWDYIPFNERYSHIGEIPKVVLDQTTSFLTHGVRLRIVFGKTSSGFATMVSSLSFFLAFASGSFTVLQLAHCRVMYSLWHISASTDV